jgi:hypothetical protein
MHAFCRYAAGNEMPASVHCFRWSRRFPTIAPGLGYQPRAKQTDCTKCRQVQPRQPPTRCQTTSHLRSSFVLVCDVTDGPRWRDAWSRDDARRCQHLLLQTQADLTIQGGFGLWHHPLHLQNHCVRLNVASDPYVDAHNPPLLHRCGDYAAAAVLQMPNVTVRHRPQVAYFLSWPVLGTAVILAWQPSPDQMSHMVKHSGIANESQLQEVRVLVQSYVALCKTAQCKQASWLSWVLDRRCVARSTVIRVAFPARATRLLMCHTRL